MELYPHHLILTIHGIHLVMLPQGRQNLIVIVEVEPWADMQIRDFPLTDPLVDGAGADRETRGEFFLFDQDGCEAGAGSDLIDGMTAVDGSLVCCNGGFHDVAWLVLSTH